MYTMTYTDKYWRNVNTKTNSELTNAERLMIVTKLEILRDKLADLPPSHFLEGYYPDFKDDGSDLGVVKRWYTSILDCSKSHSLNILFVMQKSNYLWAKANK